MISTYEFLAKWLRINKTPPEDTFKDRKMPPPIPGMEWSGLRARSQNSLIEPDEESTYTVTILDDGTFSVRCEG